MKIQDSEWPNAMNGNVAVAKYYKFLVFYMTLLNCFEFFMLSFLFLCLKIEWTEKFGKVWRKCQWWICFSVNSIHNTRASLKWRQMLCMQPEAHIPIVKTCWALESFFIFFVFKVWFYLVRFILSYYCKISRLKPFFFLI